MSIAGAVVFNDAPMMKPLTSRERFLAACRRERPAGPPPAWVMRQAGRYLPEYRELRSKHEFLELVHTPEVACELTCQPLRRFDMDAAVIFSDILLPPAAMGLDLTFKPGEGPKLNPPLREAADIDRLKDFDAKEATGFLGESIRRVRAELGPDKAIIGFCGAPFTTVSYAIEGGSSRNFENTKRMLYSEPKLFDRLVNKLVDNLIPYLAMQVEAGADVLQIFDSWGGALDAPTYSRALLPGLRRLVEGAHNCGVPVIVYSNGGGHLLEILADSGTDVLGVDWRITPEEAVARVGDQVALQGNLDPCILFSDPEVVRQEATRVLEGFAGQDGYIFNLGSGILPKTPVESMEMLFQTIRGFGI